MNNKNIAKSLICILLVLLLSVSCIIPAIAKSKDVADTQRINPLKIIIDGTEYDNFTMGDKIEYKYCMSINAALTSVGALAADLTYDNGFTWLPVKESNGTVKEDALCPTLSNSGGTTTINYSQKGIITLNYFVAKAKDAAIFNSSDCILITTYFLITEEVGTYSINTKVNTLADTDDHLYIQQGKTIDDNLNLTSSENILSFSIVLGDANLDENVSIIDVTCIQQHLAEIHKLSTLAMQNAMVSDKITLTIKDATLIQQKLAELIEHFPIEN